MIKSEHTGSCEGNRRPFKHKIICIIFFVWIIANAFITMQSLWFIYFIHQINLYKTTAYFQWSANFQTFMGQLFNKRFDDYIGLLVLLPGLQIHKGFGIHALQYPPHHRYHRLRRQKYPQGKEHSRLFQKQISVHSDVGLGSRYPLCIPILVFTTCQIFAMTVYVSITLLDG